MLIITYNIKNKVNEYNYDSVLYLAEKINSSIKKQKHVDIMSVGALENHLFLNFIKYKDHFSHIFFIDNSRPIEVDFKEIESYDFCNFFIIGNIIKNNKNIYVEDKYMADHFDCHGLLINANIFNKDKNLIEYLNEQIFGDLYFPYFSKIIYDFYDNCKQVNFSKLKYENIFF